MIKLFTSIPPKDDIGAIEATNLFCNQWKSLGAEVYSVNYDNEINRLVRLHGGDGIMFVNAGGQDNGYDRPLLSIQLLLQIIFAHSQPGDLIGIINSDITPATIYDWSHLLDSINPNEIHLFKRLESQIVDTFAQELDPFEPYKHGFDLFIMQRPESQISFIANDNFAFGVPWWDYWFPLELAAHGYSIYTHDSPYIQHSTHQERFSQETWHQKAAAIRRILSFQKGLSIDVIPSSNLELCEFVLSFIDNHHLCSLYANQLQEDNILPGFSVVTACMNREDNLLKVITSWLASDSVKEVIICDWSSKRDVRQFLSLNGIDDKRICVIRVEHKTSWCLTKAFNVALKLAKYAFTLKLDSDVQLSSDFFDSHQHSFSSFFSGNWRNARCDEEKRLNGSFLAPTAAVKAVGYYSENILTYGWDDCDLYERLSKILEKRDFNLSTITHIEQESSTRLANQLNILGLRPYYLPSVVAQEVEIRVNQILSRFLPSGKIGIGQRPEIMCIARYYGYRHTLIRELSKPFSEQGLDLSPALLNPLSLRILTVLFSARHHEIFWGCTTNSVDLIRAIIRHHPITKDDYFDLAESGFVEAYCTDILPILVTERFSPLPDIERQYSYLSTDLKFCISSINRLAYLAPKPCDASFDIPGYLKVFSNRYTTTLVNVSVKSSGFLGGFIENIKSVFRANRAVAIVSVCPASSSREDCYPLMNFALDQPERALVVVMTHDPGLYECWNLCTASVSSPYVGNWNCDDRRSDDHIGHLTAILDSNPRLLGASTALNVTSDPPSTFYDSLDSTSHTWFDTIDVTYDYKEMYQRQDWLEGEDANQLCSQNYMHCLPIWRRSIHEVAGFFNEHQFGPSADWEFWMRASMLTQKYYFLSKDVHGLYYLNQGSYGRLPSAMAKEKAINKIYLKHSTAFDPLIHDWNAYCLIECD